MYDGLARILNHELISKEEQQRLAEKVYDARRSAVEKVAKNKAASQKLFYIGKIHQPSPFIPLFGDSMRVKADTKSEMPRNGGRAPYFHRWEISDAVLERLPGVDIDQELEMYQRSKNRLFTTNQKLVAKIAFARERKDTIIDKEDLLTYGNLALERALLKYDPEIGKKTGTKFTTYASVRIVSIIRDVNRRLHRHFSIHGVRGYDYPTVIELDKSVDENGATFLHETVPDERESSSIGKNELEEIMDIYLDEKSKDILSRRYGLNEDIPMTLEQIGDVYGVTRERIRQIEARALMKLRSPYVLRSLGKL